MSNDLLKAFNAAADAAHIASLRAYNAVWDAAKAAKALHPNDECSRARHTVSNAYREVCELVIETEDIGDNVNDTPRSRGIISSAPDPKQPLKLYTWLHNNTVLTRSQVHTGSIRTHHPDAVALNVRGAYLGIDDLRKSDVCLSKQDIWECEYIDTDLNGCIRFKCIKIVETY